MELDAFQAVTRFGLGRRPAEPLPADPAGWLRAQLVNPDPALDRPGHSAADALIAMREDHKPPPAAIPTPTASVQPAAAAASAPPVMPKRRSPEIAHADLVAMADILVTTQAPFRERLAWFWANHFTVSRKRLEAPLAGPFLREAIRPHVTGRFVDMLLAVMTHPAMLSYLDNSQSVGPGSPAGQRRKVGLNENLARECLELHTVGVASGYTQADVTAFAAVLTGWSIDVSQPEPGFVFRDAAHEPGPKRLMGQSFPEGMAGGIAALTWLADHPATQHRLAVALCRHFVADNPPAAAVARIEAVLRQTGGDLGAAAATLVALPEAWRPPLTKLRTPFEYVVAVARALDLPPELRAAMPQWCEQLGQPMFGAPLPNGWADTAADWAGGEALLRRTDWAWTVSARAADRDPMSVLEACLGPLASAGTRDSVRHAGSRGEAMTLLLAGPEFFRR